MVRHLASTLGTAIVALWLTMVALPHSLAAYELPDGLEIVALGDSLTAGYRLGPKEGFVPQLEAWLAANSGTEIRVHNAGVSGDTSAGGRARLTWSLSAAKKGYPDLVILELGANDMLRAINPSQTRANLTAIMEELAKRQIPVLIAGMMATPNLGAAYAEEFNPIYPSLAAKYGASLYPFFLDGVAAKPELNLDDGIHPTKEGIAIIVEKIGPLVIKALEDKKK